MIVKNDAANHILQVEALLPEVTRECKRQIKKFGNQSWTPLEWSVILGEEVGEVDKEVLENHFNGKSLDNYREELIQVIAVAMSMVACLDRQRGNNGIS